MKKTGIFIFSLLLSFCLLSNLKVNSQQDLGSFRLSNVEPYYNSYFQPFGRSIAVSMGGGWYNTANTHKLLGVDISLIAISGTLIPDVDKVFFASSLELEDNLRLNSDPDDIPTLSAKKGDGTVPTLQMRYTHPITNEVEYQDMFPLSGGQGLGAGMAPNMLQIGIGLPKETDLKIRFIPTFSIPFIKLDEVSLWGLGVQHDLKQWIPFVNKVPILQLSAVVAYSKFSASYSGKPFPITPELFSASVDAGTYPTSTWDGQSFGIEASSFVGDVVFGLKIPVFQPYISLGFNKAKFSGGLRGSYPSITLRQDGTNVGNVVTGIDEDPINIESNDLMFNAAAGFRLKLAVITFFGQYTIQKYPMVTGGLGISIR